MPDHHIGHRIKVLETIDSSNNYAMAQVREKMAVHGECFIALEQTAGKGQMGRQWVTEKGQNLLLSVVLKTALLPEKQPFLLSMAMALGCYDLLSRSAGKEFSIKWPNDLYWRDRKAGGILIENSWSGTDWQFAIVGIGLNINQQEFDPALKNPVSLYQISGQSVDLMEVASQLFSLLEVRWQQLNAGGTEKLIQSYNSVLYRRNQPGLFLVKEEVVQATILGVNAEGELLVDSKAGQKFRVGEIRLLPAEDQD